MKLTFLSSFLRSKEKPLVVPDSLLLKKIKSLPNNSNLLVFSNTEIFHHKNTYPIALMVYDDLRGIYIFEIKEWSYDDLKNATANKAESVESSKNTLAFDKTHAIIKQKFNEILHNDGVEIFNYLLMENLSSDEYEHLNDSLQEILPKERIIFSDSDVSDIFKKLQNSTEENHQLPPADKILGTLFIQYALMDENLNVHLCNQEQIKIIEAKVTATQNLIAPPKSGKSQLLLLKALKELFKQERQKIILIKPTILSKDIAHKQFIELIEHAIIDIDLMAFEILTPIELINRHLQKLKMPLLEEKLYIDEKLMHKNFDFADLILCDDANLLPFEFIAYLKHIQKRADLLLVNDLTEPLSYELTKSYLPQNRIIQFHQTNPYAKALHLIASLLRTEKAEDIVLISNQENREKLKEDLSSYIEVQPYELDATKHLVDQKLDSLILATYSDIAEIKAKNLILMDLCFENKDILLYACNIATQTLHILYEEESLEIEELKEKYESNQNRAGVEESTL